MNVPGNAAAPGANTEGDNCDLAGGLISDTKHTPIAESCARCAVQATRTIGSVAMCDDHAHELLGPIRARVILPEGFDGVGRVVAPRLDWGDQYHELECTTPCGASWVGRGGEPCPYCAGLYERLLIEQKRLLLKPELPERADPQRTRAVQAWAQRLARSVRAGIITEADARIALDRQAGGRYEFPHDVFDAGLISEVAKIPHPVVASAP